MTEEEKQFNQWFDEYANGVKVFEEVDMKQAFTAGLEAQIEKMRCCENCKNYNNFHRHCEFDATNSVECHCNNHKLWEIKEK